jgi:hypothetical protein
VYVTGRSEGATTSLDFATIKYGASDGSQRWVRRYDGPSHESDAPMALTVSPDGSRIVVTGAGPQTTSGAFATVAYDPAGTQVWAKRYVGPAPAFGSATDVAITPDSTIVLVTGYGTSTTASDYATIAYDAVTGTKLWTSRHDGPDGLDDYAQSIVVAPDGSAAFVTGYSLGTATQEDYDTVAYSLT